MILFWSSSISYSSHVFVGPQLCFLERVAKTQLPCSIRGFTTCSFSYFLIVLSRAGEKFIWLYATYPIFQLPSIFNNFHYLISIFPYPILTSQYLNLDDWPDGTWETGDIRQRIAGSSFPVDQLVNEEMGKTFSVPGIRRCVVNWKAFESNLGVKQRKRTERRKKKEIF